MPRSGISGTYGKPISRFLRNLHRNFHCLHQFVLLKIVNTGFPFPTFIPADFFILLFILATLRGVQWNFKWALICISLMTKDAKHLLKHCLAICISSLGHPVWFHALIFNWVAFFLGIFFFVYSRQSPESCVRCMVSKDFSCHTSCLFTQKGWWHPLLYRSLWILAGSICQVLKPALTGFYSESPFQA